MRDSTWAISAQWPGGNSDRGPSAQNSAVTFCLSGRLLGRASSASMSLGSNEPSASLSGPGGMYWTGEESANDFTFFHCGVVATCWAGQSVASGGGSGTHSGCHRSGFTSWFQLLPGWYPVVSA